MAGDPIPSATHLVATGHASANGLDDYREASGQCCFCGVSARGRPAADVISDEYFTDNDLAVTRSEHVCAYCAYCMDTRALKQGHWLATRTEYRSISTGELADELKRVQRNAVTPPIAMHVSADPIRSEHAYLWTPVAHQTHPLVVDYAGQRVRIEWDTYTALLNAVEELRWHGFRGVDIRSGEPRVRDIDSVGRERYRGLDTVVDPYRGTPFLELVWTVSKSKTDQKTPPQSADA